MFQQELEIAQAETGFAKPHEVSNLLLRQVIILHGLYRAIFAGVIIYIFPPLRREGILLKTFIEL